VEFRAGALARFWDGSDRYRDELTVGVEADWRIYKSAAIAYAEKLKDGLSIGAGPREIQDRAAAGMETITHAALRGWYHEAAEPLFAADALKRGQLGDPDAQALYDRLSEPARGHLLTGLIDETFTNQRVARAEKARLDGVRRDNMNALVASFFYDDNMDDQSRHGALALARQSAYVGPATVTAMAARLDGGAGGNGGNDGTGVTGANTPGADNPRALTRALEAIRTGRVAHGGQLPGYLAENGIAPALETQRTKLLPLIEAQADPALRDILDDGRTEPSAGAEGERKGAGRAPTMMGVP
jgi:hypothetical protein